MRTASLKHLRGVCILELSKDATECVQGSHPLLRFSFRIKKYPTVAVATDTFRLYWKISMYPHIYSESTHLMAEFSADYCLDLPHIGLTGSTFEIVNSF